MFLHGFATTDLTRTPSPAGSLSPFEQYLVENRAYDEGHILGGGRISPRLPFPTRGTEPSGGCQGTRRKKQGNLPSTVHFIVFIAVQTGAS
jgi:hypothetical protein